jgi:hypothetical protein
MHRTAPVLHAVPYRNELYCTAPCTAGKYVTGDVNEAYLRNLEEQGRGKRRARPGRKTSLFGNNLQPSTPDAIDSGAGRLPASTSA